MLMQQVERMIQVMSDFISLCRSCTTQAEPSKKRPLPLNVETADLHSRAFSPQLKISPGNCCISFGQGSECLLKHSNLLG